MARSPGDLPGPSRVSHDMGAFATPAPVQESTYLINRAHRFAAEVMVGPAEDFSRLLNKFLQDLIVVSGDDDAIVVSFAPDTDPTSEGQAHTGLSASLLAKIESCIENDRPESVLVVDDISRQDPAAAGAEWLSCVAAAGASAALVCGLFSSGDLRGALLLLRMGGPGNWSHDFIENLSRIGTVIAAALAHRRTAQLLEGALRGNRRLNQQLVEIQEQERRRLAQELHDETGQYLAALKADATLVGRRVAANDDILKRSALAVVDSANHIYEVVYGVMGRLCAVDLDDLGLSRALEACVTNSGLRNRGVVCTLSTSGDIESLDDTISMTVYRIVQESLTNISKYADAATVSISVERTIKTLDDRRRHSYREQAAATGAQADRIHVDTLEIRIVDDGVGFRADDIKGGGFGIRGMRERLQALGGRLTVDSDPGNGTKVWGVLSLGASPDKGVRHG